jgi:hypothetical protein
MTGWVWKNVAMDNAETTAILVTIATLLEAGHEQSYALIVRNALSGPDHSLQEFLRSNDLWGGAGSIADQPFVGRSAQRKELEDLLIQLGKTQLSGGIANVRTKSWVETFEKWHQRGI